MMPQTPARVCSHCDGFPVVHITTGTLTPDGQRRTLAAACPACQGTDTRTAAALTSAGR
ncbi:hypothetical protein ACFYUJ_34910 [Streptomyces sp. NPDC004520]|uniref:hypothetical protein n=1 Tax=Streptomyces sp. NPDC004520 TaxID=3364702 RepID=UPI00367D6BEA